MWWLRGRNEWRSEFEGSVLAEAAQRWQTEGEWTEPERAAAVEEQEVVGMAEGEPAYWRRQ